jgi:simple sugar transport system permease protein
VLAAVVAIAGTLLISAILINVGGAQVGEGLNAMYSGAFGSWKAFSASLVKATPLIFTGLATVIAFRAKIWNIGQEGQLYAGAIVAYAAYRLFDGFPPLVLTVAVLLGAILGGALWGAIAAVIKARFGVEVLITSIMLNYIIIYILSWLVSSPWKDPATYYRQSPLIAEAAQFPPLITGTRIHLGFLIALLAAVALFILLEKTPLGYEIRAAGHNPVALSFQGTSFVRILLIVMLISGALAGLAGVGELFGIHHRLRADISLGYGYTGIAIAVLANLQPLMVVPAAIFLGGLINGSSNLQIVTGVPSAITDVIQAVVLLFLLATTAVTNYRLRTTHDT